MYSAYANSNEENHYCNFNILNKKKTFILYPIKKEKFVNVEIPLYKDYNKFQLCNHCKKLLMLRKRNIYNYQFKKKSSLIFRIFNIPEGNDKHYININATLPFRSNNINIEEPIYENIEVFNQARLNIINSSKAKCKKLLNHITSIPIKGVSNQYLRSYNPYMPMCTPIIIPSSNINEKYEDAKNLKQLRREKKIKKHNRDN
uniref:Tub domain-containing protein n=1 Tax=Strongyloides stercoralis TaxID=6248 RepID=A0A0K0ESK0_STRER